MAIEFVRIDDRLIHGQVATTWVKKYDIEQIIIVNDKVAGDKIQQSVLKMSAPPELKVAIFGVDKFTEVYNSNPIKRRTMLIYTNPEDVYKNVRGGLKFPYLNVGGMKMVEGKKKISKAVSVDERDIGFFTKLLDEEIKIEVQMVPNDKEVQLREII